MKRARKTPARATPSVRAHERGPGADGTEESVLNPAQARASLVLDGPVLVIAGAGTGKTRTLVHRLVTLVEAGVPAGSILLLTFTRRAAQEMIDRALALLAARDERPAGGTFHSFAHAMLRRYGGAIGLANDFTVLDQEDAFEILSGIRSDLKLSARGRGFPRRETIAAILSKAANEMAAIPVVLAHDYPQFVREAKELAEIGRRYEEYKAKRHLLDFDDLLLRLVRLLEESADVRARIVERYRYVMVDEYQDTNALQSRITGLLAGNGRNVMVVGDDAQSIYGFRGARYDNLFEFRETFRGATLVTLEQNYRSTQAILEVSNALMKQMSRAFRKRLFTQRQGGDKPRLVEVRDEARQASFVASETQALAARGVRLSEIAVLFRASSHAFALELELGSRRVPYVKYGGFRFTEAAHIKDALAPLRVLANPSDELSLSRLLLLCPGVGRAGARKIAKAIAGKPASEALRSYPAGKKVAQSLRELAVLMADLAGTESSPGGRIERVLEYYLPVLKVRYDDWPRRQRDLEQLVALCRHYRSLESMLSELAIDPPNASSREQLVGPDGEERLVLSTMHSAKGLEWKVVFVIQALDGCIPMVSPFEDPEPEKLDEELRLFYVAVTRARDLLYLVWPRETARGFGYGWAEPSRFVRQMPESLFIRPGVSARTGRR